MNLEEAQKFAKKAMQGLYRLDFNNCEAVLAWVEMMSEVIDRIGVQVDKTRIVNTFQKNGWNVGANCGQNFDGNCERNFAGYIVGQWLGSWHPGLPAKFINDWRNKFRKQG